MEPITFEQMFKDLLNALKRLRELRELICEAEEPPDNYVQLTKQLHEKVGEIRALQKQLLRVKLTDEQQNDDVADHKKPDNRHSDRPVFSQILHGIARTVVRESNDRRGGLFPPFEIVKGPDRKHACCQFTPSPPWRGYFSDACAAAKRATGTRYGEQLT